MEEKEYKHYIRKSLLERGWTDSLIRKYLPEPDLIKQNPMYKKAPAMKLYLISKVEDIEKTETFQTNLNKTKTRKDGAKKATETKTNKLLDICDLLKIEVKLFSKDEILKLSIKNYNNWQSQFDNAEYADFNSDKSFLERISVNFIRHNLTSYDDHLDEIIGKVGKTQAYEIIREKVLRKISEIYPYLKHECQRQN